ncbi:conserved membrane protein of unknown function [Tenacibaculum sp. 190130A14a]|uniref:Lycopene cyclase domain-containing protein n=1 Tax=Tenacibaculum polynesiense TaxID=3137857 RepID=A0ABP1EWY5_9FLAO
MIPNLPLFISISFVLTTVYVIFLFIKSNTVRKSSLFIVLLWTVVLSILSYAGLYHYQEGDTYSRFVYILLPSIIFMVFLLRNKANYETRDFKWSTALHIVRLPIELLLFQLAVRKWIPMEMTYEGWNYDIIPGVTAVILVAWMNYRKIDYKLLLGWNIVSLCLVLFILSNGFLSQELLYINFGYAVPNKAIAYFPMVLLAGVIVPIVVYTHISDIILLKKKISEGG